MLSHTLVCTRCGLNVLSSDRLSARIVGLKLESERSVEPIALTKTLTGEGVVSRERTAVMLYLCKVVSGIVPWGLFAAYRVAGQLSKHIVTHIGLITRFDFRSKCSRKTINNKQVINC